MYAGGSNSGTLAVVKGMTEWSYIHAPDKTNIYIYDEVVTKTRPYGVGEELSGIDLFVGTVIHERTHVDQIIRADTLVTSSGNDAFRHGWSWNQAYHNHWHKGLDRAWGVAGVDDDANRVVDDAAKVPPFEPGRGDDVCLDLTGVPQWPSIWPLPIPNNCFHPIESEAVNYTDAAINENDNVQFDWGDPGKNHATIGEWSD